MLILINKIDYIFRLSWNLNNHQVVYNAQVYK